MSSNVSEELNPIVVQEDTDRCPNISAKYFKRQEKQTTESQDDLTPFHFVTMSMGPLQLTVTWYKIRHAGECALGHPKQSDFI